MIGMKALKAIILGPALLALISCGFEDEKNPEEKVIVEEKPVERVVFRDPLENYETVLTRVKISEKDKNIEAINEDINVRIGPNDSAHLSIRAYEKTPEFTDTNLYQEFHVTWRKYDCPLYSDSCTSGPEMNWCSLHRKGFDRYVPSRFANPEEAKFIRLKYSVNGKEHDIGQFTMKSGRSELIFAKVFKDIPKDSELKLLIPPRTSNVPAINQFEGLSDCMGGLSMKSNIRVYMKNLAEVPILKPYQVYYISLAINRAQDQ